jgi:hypothetical protein
LSASRSGEHRFDNQVAQVFDDRVVQVLPLQPGHGKRGGASGHIGFRYRILHVKTSFNCC